MSDAWLVVGLTGIATVALKGFGPVLLGGRHLPPLAMRALALVAPALLAALVATQTFADGRRLAVDARLPGLLAAAVALRLRAPLLGAVVLAAAVTALIRAV